MDETGGAFWYRVAAWTFGLWAIMIPIGVAIIRNAISTTTTTQEKFLSDFHAYVLHMERRVTVLEERLRVNHGEHDFK
jgi:hypothetical protein